MNQKKRKFPKIRFLVIGILALSLITTGLIIYQTRHRHVSDHRISTMEAAYNDGQRAVNKALKKYVQTDSSFFNTATKECYVSGEGYGSNTNRLECSITNKSTDGGYIKANNLDNTQLTSLMKDVDSQLKSKGYQTRTFINDSIQQYAVLANRNPSCSLDFSFNKQLPNIPNASAPKWVTDTSTLQYMLSCRQPIITGQPGSFQISCSDKYKSTIPSGYNCP